MELGWTFSVLQDFKIEQGIADRPGQMRPVAVEDWPVWPLGGELCPPFVRL